jgi:glutamate N-acetyltransferase/amino-acid N-acetyltransferase
MAVGKNFDCVVEPASTNAWINGFAVVEHGCRVPFDDATVRAALGVDVVEIIVDLGVGTAEATAWGCDLSHGYVDENAAYYSS